MSLSWQLISITDIELERLILKHPIHIGNDDKGKPRYSSEIWYKPEKGKPFKPVFKTPRLKIKYGCKPSQSSYSYCISSYNSDIDDDIGDFFTFVRKLDRKLNNLYRQACKIWGFEPAGRYKYFSSIKRSIRKQSYVNNNDNGFMNLKVITGSNKGDSLEPLTKINDSSTGNKLEPESIRYGFYADQIISLSYLYYNDEGISPVWFVHQTVVSESVNVFLEYCLLDEVGSYSPPTPQPPQPPTYSSASIPPPPIFNHSTIPPCSQRKAPVTSMLSSIRPDELLSVIGKLRNIRNNGHNGNNGKQSENDNIGISAKKLQERKLEIDIEKQRKLFQKPVSDK